MSNIQLDIEWTEAASRKIEKLMPRNTKDKDAYLALPPVECLLMEGDVLFLGPDGKQRRVRQVFLPKTWEYDGAFLEMGRHLTDTHLPGAVRKHDRGAMYFEA